MLELTLTSEDIDFECPTIYGISSNVKFYRLAWHLHQLKTFELIRQDDVENYQDLGRHGYYVLNHLDDCFKMALVKNRGTKGYYYKKFKDFDYLLFSIAEENRIDHTFMTMVKKLDCITLCLELDPPKSPEDLNFIQLL